jgi:hypothetical protein
MASEGYHESPDLLSEGTKDLHRALVSLREELEAVDWYQQRAEATSDGELKSVLLHNRDEEVEHALMLLEWIRRRQPEFDAAAKTYLFSSAPIVEVEHAETGKSGAGGEARPAPEGERAKGSTLGIGSLKKG